MREEILSRMPKVVQQALEEVEATCSVKFELHSNSPDAGCYVSRESSGVILIKDPCGVKPASVLHEVLHLKRYLLHGVPQLVSSTQGGFASLTENNLEHLFVVPKQRALGIGDDDFWISLNNKAWDAFERTHSSGLERKVALVQRWFDAQFTYDQNTLQRAHKIAVADGIGDWIESFWAHCNELICDKPKLVRHYLTGLGLPLDKFALRYLDGCVKSI